MKKLTLTLISVAVVIAAGLATYAIIKRYDASKAARQEEATKTAEAQQVATNSTIAALQTDKSTLVSQYNQLHDQCLKGKAAYDLLAPANRAKTDAPACGNTK